MKLKLLLATVLALLSLSTFAAQFSKVQADQVPSGMPYNIKMPPVTDRDQFTGKRIAILASHGVEEPEITLPYQYLTERGAQVDIVVPSWTPQGIVISLFLMPHLWVTADKTFTTATNETYDLLILTGGAWNSQVVKSDSEALQLINKHYAAGRPLAAICAGTEVLISAGLIKGLTVTGPSYARTNLVNAGAIVQDHPAVISDGILTSRDPNDIPSFVAGIDYLLSDM
ncbi:MAG: hypothetical protein A2504_09410 [Bdellovibrionales bacterium RIFOXYD12_FULL_39_22]|nr:MAG: hypothetical protein A2385_17140 [Bdellovibrionales bacterium RIFOXYB1_FULL_39_21]OFZ41043.1 MAG: hypothetical protein A2485_00065 [Bdellovibrionales bacterium RIFOXYC12_FULL_39_17]OFZ50256.1 MAG: hypothetical protein A2404_07380 [Bdellovibrionales bacterium RIFOXYC1_FULL_39_130]OFZ75057.1 MAG: hypothetical protein A2560_16075 [Bdellovibrionales bacterium RIFOXYD1_FULL_39_84]OFZ92301.1 MAG: hypothetical protein A2504_09410 [Bdellovibrionales bacterium RIFOXYD12_FULL_39_22]HLE10895.1 DJ